MNHNTFFNTIINHSFEDTSNEPKSKTFIELHSSTKKNPSHILNKSSRMNVLWCFITRIVSLAKFKKL